MKFSSQVNFNIKEDLSFILNEKSSFSVEAVISQPLFIEITNTFVSIPQERDGELITDKKNSNIHGYGMKSIKRIVKKYDGFIECQVKEKNIVSIYVFIISKKEVKEK